MNRLLLAGLLALVSGLTGLAADKQPQPKSQKELDAVKAMFEAQTPDARITAAENLLLKFADTEFKAIALYLEAASYEQKNDFEKMVIFAERTIEADPKNYASMLMLAGGIAKRARENDLDLNEKLAQVDKYAKNALEALKDAPKPNPQLSDEQWTATKKDYVSQAHEAYALSAMLRKKYDVAITEFKMAVEGAATPDPATMVRLGQAYNAAGKPDDAIAILDKVMAGSDVHPQIKQFAQAERVRAIQAKGGAKPPTPPPAAPPSTSSPTSRSRRRRRCWWPPGASTRPSCGARRSAAGATSRSSVRSPPTAPNRCSTRGWCSRSSPESSRPSTGYGAIWPGRPLWPVWPAGRRSTTSPSA